MHIPETREALNNITHRISLAIRRSAKTLAQRSGWRRNPIPLKRHNAPPFLSNHIAQVLRGSELPNM
jgi:hypothetical protein